MSKRENEANNGVPSIGSGTIGAGEGEVEG